MESKIFTFLFFLCFFSSNGQSDILITPFRVVLENGKTIEELSVANTGSDTARYTISFVQYKMNEDGQLKQITSPEEGQFFADRFLRVFPKSIMLAPREAQIIRLQARIPADALAGEYRSHLYFRSAGEQQSIGLEPNGTDGLGIELIPVYGITIPVIVRIGSSDIKVALKNPILRKGDHPFVDVTISRTGIHSTYGDLELVHYDMDGTERILGLVRGVAVYTPLASRTMKIPFNKVTALPTSGRLKIVYYVTANGKKVILSESDFFLNE